MMTGLSLWFLSLLIVLVSCTSEPATPNFSRSQGPNSDVASQRSADVSSSKSDEEIPDALDSPPEKNDPNKIKDGGAGMPDSGSGDVPITSPVNDSGKAPDGTVEVSKVPTPPLPLKLCTSVDYSKVTKPEDFACLGSAEGVFKTFPEWLQPYFALMHSSRSPQQASLSNPRVLVASPDGSFIFAASTFPNAGSEIEIAVYDYISEQWNFAGIDFTTNPPKIEKELCKNCHGEGLRTIWGSYRAWDGAYGHPVLDEKPEQIRMLETFRVKGATVPPLLKYLKYKPSYSGTDAQFNAASGYTETETNEMFGIMMAIKASRSLAAKILKPGAVTSSQLKDILVETLCTTFQTDRGTVASLNAANFPVEKHLFHGIESDNGRREAMALGFQSEIFFFGLILLEKAMNIDPKLKAALPEVAKLFAIPRYAFAISSNGVNDFLNRAARGDGNWVTTRDEVRGPGAQFFPRDGNSSSCSILKNYTK